MTPSVQYWVSNSGTNYGWVIDRWLEGSNTSDSLNGVNMRSSEYDTVADRPELVITYVISEAEPYAQLRLSDLNLNYWNTDPGITFSSSSGRLLCSGTTSDAIWGADGAVTTYSLNSSFESSIKVKLQQGVVNIDQGEFGFGIYEPSTMRYIRILAVGYSAHYYEISGTCAASGNGEYHDGTAYWASYWDDYYPTYPPASPAVRFFAQTPEDEATAYLTWRIRYDKPNGMFYVGVNDVLVTYYSKVNLSNFLLAIMHDNNRSGVPTTVWTDFPDETPPSPDPMTWATQPYAASTSSIGMIATTATDQDHPPVSYYFAETSGNPGGSSYRWTSNTAYTDGALSANTQYGYKVKARDSYSTPNETAYSNTVNVYTLIPAPTGCQASASGATNINLAALGSFPNLSQGQTGVQFETTTPGWTGSWRLHETTDTATGLTPNTPYTFHVRSRNGDGIATSWSAGTASKRTLAADPTPQAYGPISCQAIQANWGANGNPFGTEYYCQEVTTGRGSGWITGTSWLAAGLSPGTQYQFQVKARNADLVETGLVDLGLVSTQMSIGLMKQRFAPGETVALTDKVVTASFADQRLFFIQDARGLGGQEGIPGVAVEPPRFIDMPKPGQHVDLIGQLAYNVAPYDQELIIKAFMVTAMISGFPPMPYGCNGRGLGGGPFGCQPGVFDDLTVDPPVPSTGLSTIGMLVRTWGQGLDGGLGGNGFFWVWDGSSLNDLEEAGVRVSLEPIGGVIQPVPQYCAVAGIMRCMMVDGPAGRRCNVRVIWPRISTDIVEYGP